MVTYAPTAPLRKFFHRSCRLHRTNRVLRNALERDVRHGFAIERVRPGAAVVVAPRAMRIALALFGIDRTQFVEIELGREQTLPRQCHRHAARVHRDPPPAPLSAT